MIMNRAKAVWTLHGANILGEYWGHEVCIMSHIHDPDPTIILFSLLFTSTALSCPLSFTPTYRGCPGSRNRTGRYVPLTYPDLNSVLRACYHLYSYNDRLETFLNPLSFPPLLLYSSTGELVYNLTLKETVFLVFDVLAVEGRACLQLPFSERQRIIR